MAGQNMAFPAGRHPGGCFADYRLLRLFYLYRGQHGRPAPCGTALTTRFYYATGELLATRSCENRIEIPLAEMPDYARWAMIAVEDERFYSHPGIDVMGVARAMVRNLQERRITQGGSTITQQLAKNLFLSHDRTFPASSRKRP
jgi:membrane carboxypeptidase/penicillin-binding protein